jgi:hypothetical protein
MEVVASLREVSDGDSSFIASLVDLYRRQFEQKSREIRLAGSSGQLAKIASNLHIVKSSSGNLGALQFHDYCAELERIAMSGENAEVIRRLPEFFAYYGEVLEEVGRVFAAELKSTS